MLISLGGGGGGGGRREEIMNKNTAFSSIALSNKAMQFTIRPQHYEH